MGSPGWPGSCAPPLFPPSSNCPISLGTSITVPPLMHESEKSNQFAVCYREKVVLQMIGGRAKAALSSSCTRITSDTADVDVC